MLRTLRLAGLAVAFIGGALALAGCTAPGLIITAVGIGTDTSMTWDIVKHVHGKLTEDDPTPCAMLNSVQRALNPRCEFVAGSIRVADLKHSGLQDCPLAAATQRSASVARPAGADRERRQARELRALAAAGSRRSRSLPRFPGASPAILKSMVYLAETDPRAVRHDVFRMLGCSRARAVGLDSVLVVWLDRGSLQPGALSFSPLEALDPDLLVTRFGRELQVAGHSPSAALDHYDGSLPSGFEEALRTANWAALEWWFYELPQLANKAPPSRGGQMDWVPLQRVLLPGFLQNQASQGPMVGFLMAHGADPRKKLPFDPDKNVIGFAKSIKSPMLALLDTPPAPAATLPTTLARSTIDANAPGGGVKSPRDNLAARSLRQAARFDVKATADDTRSR